MTILESTDCESSPTQVGDLICPAMTIVPKQCVYKFTRLRAVRAATARLLYWLQIQNRRPPGGRAREDSEGERMREDGSMGRKDEKWG